MKTTTNETGMTWLTDLSDEDLSERFTRVQEHRLAGEINREHATKLLIVIADEQDKRTRIPGQAVRR